MKSKFKANILIITLAFFSLLFAYIASIYDSDNSSRNMKNIQRLKMTDKKFDAKVVIYTKPTCGYCLRAKNFLKDIRVKYEEVDVSLDPMMHQELIEQTGSRTVPLIFINDKYIGGCSDMLEMSEDGRLETILLR